MPSRRRRSGAVLLTVDTAYGEWTIIADKRCAGTGVRALVMALHARGCWPPDPETGVCDLPCNAGDMVRGVSTAGPGTSTLWAYRT